MGVKWTRHILFQSLLLFLIVSIGIRLIRPPLPANLIALYTAILILAILAYVTASQARTEEFLAPIQALILDPRRKRRLALLLALPPLGVGYWTFTKAGGERQPPVEFRTVHPEPPLEYVGRQNPFRASPASLAQALAEGKTIYYRNCVFCHGDRLEGTGPFAHGFNPPPADFEDPGTIAQLPESYLFWRIKKGGRGLPQISTPWNSAMPAFEQYLTDDQIWKVIAFLYDQTGYPPPVR